MNALIVEDEGLTRNLLSGLLRREFDFDEIVQAADGDEAWELFLGDEFTFIMIDLIIPKLDGLSLARKILEHGRGKKIIVLSSECDDYTVKEVSRSGIFGYIDKPGMSEFVLLEAIRTVLQGRIYMSAAVRKVMDRIAVDPDAYYKVLSDREMVVLRLLSKCETDESIAQELDISPFTVRRHRLNIMNKLNLKSVAQLIRYALDQGIVKHKSGLGWS
ncbi:response regulator transcription factor [Coraliomargarita sp. SDUM461003]|uniref:Response regulator transcription factor n=1 Tax=Thalassobacterium maritimum TaxID=3041265 RepID=A0ABU1APK7_9BACT|nr:response regulator transcription factor [Coraliomargarita sp. SDUM461003]MDQ8206086.1 response regulator transcription factor [Coraliomargarita sp. SDUM461003]